MKRMLICSVIFFPIIFYISGKINYYEGFTFYTAGIESPLQFVFSAFLLLLALFISAMAVKFRYLILLIIASIFWITLAILIAVLIAAGYSPMLLVLYLLPWWGLGILEHAFFRYGTLVVCLITLILMWSLYLSKGKKNE